MPIRIVQRVFFWGGEKNALYFEENKVTCRHIYVHNELLYRVPQLGRILKNNSTLLSEFSQILAHSSCGWWPGHLLHKIENN
jgi:hypothetical protein